MTIHVDGGALCADANHQFGNYVVSKNILDSITRCDKENTYCIYTFCNNIRNNSKNVIYKSLTPSIGFMPHRVGFEEFVHKSDVFLALNQALPLYTKGKKIVLSHGLSFMKFPQLYTVDYARLSKQLHNMYSNADCIIVSSNRVKEEFNNLFSKKVRIEVIPFGIPWDMIGKQKIENNDKPYFLYVGMNHPIKNISGIIKAFLNAKKKTQNKTMRLKLVGVGNNIPISDKNIDIVPVVSRNNLIKIYQNATALLTASHYESFNLSVLEALSCNVPVIGLQSAIIPELEKYVYVCNSTDEFVKIISECMENGLVNKVKLDTKLFSWDTFVSKLMTLY